MIRTPPTLLRSALAILALLAVAVAVSAEARPAPSGASARGAPIRLTADTLPVPDPRRAPAAGKTAKAKARGGEAGTAAGKAIRDLLALKLPEADLRRVKDAVTAIYNGAFEEARRFAAEISDPDAAKLVLWYRLRSEELDASPEEIARFRRDNPGWPDGPRLARRAEEALFLKNIRPRAVIAFFGKSAPRTGAGMAALAGARLALGEREEARKLVSRLWRTRDLSEKVRDAVLERFGTLLTQADHKWRLDRILLRDSRWRSVRRQRVARARALLPYLSKAERAKAEARIAVYLRRLRKARRLYARLPKGAMKDPGVLHHKIQLLRRTKRHEAAWALLAKAPRDRAALVSPADWWIERRVNAYKALNSGKPKVAYRLVSRLGGLPPRTNRETNGYIASQFLAGWIALRFLDRPKQALVHFEALAKVADGPRSKSRAQYWLGRTRLALGEKEKAKAHFRAASVFFNTFYGQVARQTLDPTAADIEIAPPPEPSAQAIARFTGRSAVRALVIAHKAGLSKIVRVFLSGLRWRLKSEDEFVLLARLAVALGDTQMAVRIGKTGLLRGWRLAHFAYPTHAMPRFRPLRPLPERALLFAIARQESEFNTLIESGAGARGILQVMPGTARHICRQYRIRCRISALKSDPAYNAKLASAYIGDRLSDYGGSYVMTLPGYNAGPGRVRGWVKELGDPRAPHIDPIDWIERLHISETRNYVKKVLANLQVYRARLGDPKKALRILRDLVRARFSRRSGTVGGLKVADIAH